MKIKALARLKETAAYDLNTAKKQAEDMLDTLKDAGKSSQQVARQVSNKTGLPIEDVKLLMKNRGWFIKPD